MKTRMVLRISYGRLLLAAWAGLLWAGASGLLAQRVNEPPPPQLDTVYRTNSLLLRWRVEPNGTYQLLSGPDVTRLTRHVIRPGDPCTAVQQYPGLNQIVMCDPIDPADSRFYVVAMRPTDERAATIWKLSPCGGSKVLKPTNSIQLIALGVPYAQVPIASNKVQLQINGNNLQWGNPRLQFTNNGIDSGFIYTPAPGEVHGQPGETNLYTLQVSNEDGTEVAGFSWALVVAPESETTGPAFDAAAPGSGLTYVEDNGTTYTYSYTDGQIPALPPGSIFGSSDPAHLFHGWVEGVVTNELDLTLSITLSNATLSALLDPGATDLRGSPPPPEDEGGGLRAADGTTPSATFSLTGRTLHSIDEVEAVALQGGATFQPVAEARALFGDGRLTEADISLNGIVSWEILFRATATQAGRFTNRVEVGESEHLLAVDRPGGIPAWLRARIIYALAIESEWDGPGTVTAGLGSTNIFLIGSTYREGVWAHQARDKVRLRVPAPVWPNNLGARLRVELQVQVALNLDGGPGPTYDLRPFVETVGRPFSPPGRAGWDVFVHEGMEIRTAGDLRGWDPGIGPEPEQDLLRARQVVYHRSAAQAVVAVTNLFRPGPDLVWIPPGRFAFGGAGAKPSLDVTLSRGFYIGRREVTQREYAELLPEHRSHHQGGVWGELPERPVEQVSWQAATQYCALLTLRERRAGRLPEGNEYRLPTEAEWEYANRASTTNRYHYGDQLLAGMAAFDCVSSGCVFNPAWQYGTPGRTEPQTLPTGLFAPNYWGLHDTHGNVAEWCQDWLGDPLPSKPVVDPVGPRMSPNRAVRGGSFASTAADCASPVRFTATQLTSNLATGFRIVLAPVPPKPANLELLAGPPPAPVVVRESFTLTLAVTNAGPGGASNVVLSSVLPAGLLFVQTPNACTHTAGVVRCKLGDLAPGATDLIAITVRALIAGTLTNTATLSSFTEDPEPTGNTVQQVFTILPATRADLQAALSAGPLPALSGSNLTLSLHVTNLGPDRAENVQLTSPLPAGLQFLGHLSSTALCSNLGGQVTCSLGTLPAGAAASVALLVRPLSPGLLTTVVQADSSTPDRIPGNNRAELVLDVTAGSAPLAQFGYTNRAWRYLATGQDPGLDWIGVNYDDSGWPLGPGLFGLEAGTDVYPGAFQTLIPPPTTGPITAYFRTRFPWAGPTDGVVLDASLLADDGAVMFVNGVEVYRFHVPPGQNALTPAESNVEGLDEGVPRTFALTNALVPGENIVAVELHQAPGTDDVAFGLSLSVRATMAPGLVIRSENGITVTWDAAGYVLQSGPTPQGPWTQVATHSPYVVAASEGQSYFRLWAGP